jgi:hypothetical protein
MNDLNELTECLDKMLSKQKEKKARTFVARYKGKNLITSSGKSSWKAVNHAKAAILLHFSNLETAYAYGYELDENGRPPRHYDLYKFTYAEKDQRREEFRKKLWELIEIVELE